MRRFVFLLMLFTIFGCERPRDPPLGTPVVFQPTVTAEPEDPRLAVDLPVEVRRWYKNFPAPGTGEGSCVQCSIGMCGVDQNVPAASSLLWDSEYGRAELGGSYPSRVAAYARERGLRVYNVTGSGTIDWMRWAMSTGRGAAVACDSAHFQTLVGYDRQSQTWQVCDNNHPDRIDVYSDAEFRRLHAVTGQWVVILDYPPHPSRPQYARWW